MLRSVKAGAGRRPYKVFRDTYCSPTVQADRASLMVPDEGMQMRNTIHFVLAAAATALFAGCTTPPAEMADAKVDPRQGEEVRQVCFTSQIRNWRENDNRSVIVEARVRDEYKLELIGTCQPRDAFTSIGLVSRGGGSCLSTGDQLITDARYNDGSCSIRRIYKWNKDAGQAPAAGATPS